MYLRVAGRMPAYKYYSELLPCRWRLSCAAVLHARTGSQVLARFMGVVMGGRVKFEPSQMVLTAGATPTLEILAFSLAQPGEAFLVPSPYYSGFDRDINWRSQVELIPIPCSRDTDFQLAPGVLESTYRRISRMGVKIRGVLISNPSNPVGNILDRAALTSLLSFTQSKKIHLILDGIFAGCTHKHCRNIGHSAIQSKLCSYRVWAVQGRGSCRFQVRGSIFLQPRSGGNCEADDKILCSFHGNTAALHCHAVR